MNFFEQLFAVFSALPASKKATMIGVIGLVITGFILMFVWANQIDYQPLYTDLCSEDAAAIVSKLKEQKVPYRLEANGHIVLVPSDRVYDLRLSFAGAGLPRGGAVGFELFDKTDFNATEFVQRLNYQRALQGELMRTINRFKEVLDSRVIIVFPRESVFVEDSQPASASVLLTLRSALTSEKVAAIVHLVSSSVERLDPEHVTVVDNSGNVLFKGTKGDEFGALAGTQLEYQRNLEKSISDRVQSMLESVVGPDKAIVRVSSDIDFDTVETNEDIYDPEGSVVRSKQRKSESSERTSSQPEEVADLSTAPAISDQSGGSDRSKQDNSNEVLNYEINKLNRRTVKPSGAIKRLSIAVVLDGTYRKIKDKDGKEHEEYAPRTQEELREFEAIASKASGYNSDRGDQITVSCQPFPKVFMDEEIGPAAGPDWQVYIRQYAKSALNFLLILIVFVFVVRPLLKSMKEVHVSEIMEQRQIPEMMQGEGRSRTELLTATPEKNIRDEIAQLTKANPERSQQLIKGWLGQPES
ncbi:MAG: flagellar basal-body MS-ring/collar protein FliF [Pseudomonadota bacterium]